VYVIVRESAAAELGTAAASNDSARSVRDRRTVVRVRPNETRLRVGRRNRTGRRCIVSLSPRVIPVLEA
jgi:hypothetical protein